jgi:hypothetical protein
MRLSVHESVVCGKLALTTAVDRSYHISEVRHAKVQASSLAEQTVVKLSLVFFCIGRGVPNRLTILLLCVASPHGVNGVFARQEIV